MYEIELKAHVEDRNAVIAALNSFAEFCGTMQKEDTYYRFSPTDADGKHISARIRTETTDAGNADGKTSVDGHSQRILLTYKRKELRTDANGTAIEVNDEKECALSSAEAVEALLADIGFCVSLTKSKHVMSWKHDGALFELCDVPPLGDFLEIEMLSPTNDAETVAHAQKILRALLAKAGITADKIEERYYSDMLRALKQE